jgi:hypothetical protein
MLKEFGLEPTTADHVKVGQAFGRLTIIAIGKIPGTYRYMAVCVCSCGSPAGVHRTDHLLAGNSRSCGCLKVEACRTHGLSDSPHYSRWSLMMSRCYNKDDPNYKNYGARGIKVCERWHHIRNYVAELPDGYREWLELDRRDNDGDYEPGNVRWVTRQKNCDNRRTRREITFEGKTLSFAEWSRETGLPVGVIKDRFDTWGWSAERTLTEPIADRKQNMRRAQSMRWSGHAKKPAPEPRVIKTFMFNSRPQTIRDISQYTGISIELLRKRLCERNWPIDKATRDGRQLV